MISMIIGLLLIIILMALVFWAARYLQLPDMIQRIIVVLFVVIIVIWVVYIIASMFGVAVPPGPARW